MRQPRETIARGGRSFPIEYKAGLLRKARNSLHRHFQGRHEPQNGHPLTAGIGRAEAMAYRDEIGEAMTDPDWSEVECRLRRAYWSLKAAVARGEP